MGEQGQLAYGQGNHLQAQILVNEAHRITAVSRILKLLMTVQPANDAVLEHSFL